MRRKLTSVGVELVSTGSGFLIRDRSRAEEPSHVTVHRLQAAENAVSSSDSGDNPSAECQVVQRSLWDYLDGRCTSQLAERIDAHVSSCVPCSRFRQFQERFFESVAEVRERSPAPARLHDRVREALEAERRGDRQR